ncbi:MAG TPA: hypothetical protein VI318_06355 [Baekduia sp.]
MTTFTPVGDRHAVRAPRCSSDPIKNGRRRRRGRAFKEQDMHNPRTTLATLAAIGATLPVAIPTAAQARPEGAPPSPPAGTASETVAPARPEGAPTSSLAGTTSGTVAQAQSTLDLRSPDAQDAATARAVDVRPVDARHAALRGNGALPPHATATSTTVDDDSAWGDVAIVGGATAAVLAVSAGALLAGQRRRHDTPAASR